MSFDLAVFINEWPELLRPVFNLLDEGRILDILTRQKLLDNAEGTRDYYSDEIGDRKKREYSLDVLAKRHGYPVILDKDTWRKRYAELESLAIRDWPQEAVDYSAHDSRAALWVCKAQNKGYTLHYLEDQGRQMQAAWALHLLSMWGVRTDPVMVKIYREKTIARLESHKQILIDAGMLAQEKGKLVRKRKPAQEYAVKVWEQAIQTRAELSIPITKTGISCDEDAVTMLGDPLLIAYQEYGSTNTIISKVDDLAEGIYLPIHTHFEELLVTGRTSSSNPPLQNRPVDPGDRECFVPRKGNVFIDSDYSGLELCTFAQSCLEIFEHSRLAEVLNSGGDPHAMIAAQLLDIPLSEVLRRKKDKKDLEVYNARQTGKIANFGLGGGLGWKALIVQARTKYGVSLTEQSAKNLIQVWLNTWPEATEYFNWLKALDGPFGITVMQLYSDRYRGRCSFTEAANTFFQGMGADVTKHALYELVKATFVGTSANLRECRVWNYIHDQFIVEAPEEIAHECALEKQRIIEDAANELLLDVPVKALPSVCRRWSKLIPETSALDGYGRSIPWEWDEAVKAGSTGCID